MIATIDPGSTGTGVAVWRGEKLFRTIAIIPPKTLEWEQKVVNVAVRFAAVIESLRTFDRDDPLDRIYVEYPKLFQSTKGVASAERGDLVKLSVIVGVIVGVSFSSGINTTLLPVNTWKGQLSKTQVDARIHQVLLRKFPDHVSDAVGMGLFIFKRAFQEIR